MAKKKNKNLFWLVLVGFVLLRSVARSGALRNLFLTNTQIAQMYREMIQAGTAITYTVTRGNDTVFWHIDLARVTDDYEAVKAEYFRLYNRNLTTDLMNYFSELGEIHLSDYIAELWKYQQVLTA